MKKKYPLLAVLSGALALPLAAQAQVTYEYEQVDFPGSPETQVFGINQPGVLVGNGFDPTVNSPFIYDTKQGSFAGVDAVAEYEAISALGINNRGDVVGSVAGSGGISGFILDHTGIEATFDHPEATFFTQARGVNSRGLVTGFRDSGFFSSVGFIYDPASATFTDIVPSLFTIAQGINSRGDVVGSAIFPSDADPCNPSASAGGTVRYGWLRTQQDSVSYFTVNGRPTSARGIDDTGTVTGFFRDTAAGESFGFVTVLDGTPCQDITIDAEDLLVFPGATETFPQDITNSGVIAGQYTDEAGVSHGFIATPE